MQHRLEGEPRPRRLEAAWHGDSAKALIERADAVLYEAKAAGRNRVRGDRAARAA